MNRSSRRPGARIALVAVVVLVALVAGTALAAVSTGLWVGAGDSPTPSASATPLARATASPSPSPSPSLTASPSASPSPVPTATPVAGDPEIGELVFSVAPWSDIVQPFTTSLMADGRLTTIRIGGGPGALTQQRLTPEGIRLVRGEILDTGLFGESAFYGPVPRPGHELPGRGASGFGVALGTPDGIVSVGWMTVEGDEVEWAEPSPERERLDQLGERLVTLDSWLPAEAWLEQEPIPYLPARYRLFTISQPWGGDLDELPPELGDVVWPLDGTVLTFGDEVEGSHPDYLMRCGVVSADEAAQVWAALGEAGASMEEPGTQNVVSGGLGQRATTRLVEVMLVAIHPHEVSCEGASPPSFY
jgi:hypothetical protein